MTQSLGSTRLSRGSGWKVKVGMTRKPPSRVREPPPDTLFSMNNNTISKDKKEILRSWKMFRRWQHRGDRIHIHCQMKFLWLRLMLSNLICCQQLWFTMFYIYAVFLLHRVSSCLGIFFTIIIVDHSLFLIWRHLKFSRLFYNAGCKLSGHQELVRPDMSDCSWHDQGKDAGGDSKNLQHQERLHTGGRGGSSQGESVGFWMILSHILKDLDQ